MKTAGGSCGGGGHFYRRFYSNERQELDAAVNCLISLKQKKLDPDEARVLNCMKRKFLGNYNVNPISRKYPRIIFKNLGGNNNKEQDSKKILPGTEPVTALVRNSSPFKIPSVPGLNGLITNCSKPFEKQLTISDLGNSLNRLLMRKADVETNLLSLLHADEDVGKGIEVTVYDYAGNEFEMGFKYWCAKYYVLNGEGWKKFRDKHNLLMNEDDVVTIWMFRKGDTNELCFAIKFNKSK